MNARQDSVILHASCVAVKTKALLIIGPSGSGKSALALDLIALGAVLVADDRTEVTAENGAAIASCPTALVGLIEARGVGILVTEGIPSAKIALVVDLGHRETERLPPRRHVSIAGVQIDLVLGPRSGHLCAAVLCYLKGRRHE